DAPLRAERLGIRLRKLGRVARRLDLGVDDDLRPGSRLDGGDRLLGRADLAPADDVGSVVDMRAGDGWRVRRSGRPGRRREGHEGKDREDARRDQETDRDLRGAAEIAGRW